ncbi:MAG: MerR family transcriptional regulator, partial [Chitinophagaceae bacterium]
MNQFSISDIENLTRIKAHTLRIWESRYDLFVSKRLPSGHRYYDGEDLKKMLLIASLYYNGYKISQIAAFSEAEIRQKTLVLDEPTADPEKYLNSLMEASLDLNHAGMAALLNTMVAQLGVERMISHVIFPFLKKLGLFWLTGHVLPSQEHFASSLLMHCLLREIDALPSPVKSPTQRNILLFTPQGEQHEIPLLYTYYLLKK